MKPKWKIFRAVTGMRGPRAFALRLAVTVVLCALIIRSVDPAAAARVAARIESRWLLAAVGIHLLGSLLLTFRLGLVLRALHPIRIHPARLYLVHLMSIFFNSFLPTDFGGDIFKIQGIRESALPAGRAVAAVVVCRIIGFLSLGWLLAGGLWFGLLYLPPAATIPAFLFVLFSLTALVYLLLPSGGPLPVLSAGRGVRVIETARTLRSQPVTVLCVALLSLSFQLLLVAGLLCYGRALNTPLPFFGMVTVFPLVSLVSALPFSVNGIGLREGAFMVMLGWLGFSPEAGILVALLARSVSGVLLPLMGGVAYIFFRHTAVVTSAAAER